MKAVPKKKPAADEPPAHKIKIGYIAAQYRIRLDIPRSDIIRLEKPPEDLFVRAEKKLQAEQKQKRIKF